MPYIKDENNRRKELRDGDVAKTAGELNYQIFTHVKYDNFNKDIIKTYIKNFIGDKPNYQKYNDMTGAVDRCCIEILRRLKTKQNVDGIIDVIIDILASYDDEIGLYEDKKIIENGDV